MSPIYYRNARQKVAVSLDDGGHVLLPTGRLVERDPAWVDAEDDLYDELTPEQKARVDAVQAREDARRDFQDAAADLAADFNRERDARRKEWE